MRLCNPNTPRLECGMLKYLMLLLIFTFELVVSSQFGVSVGFIGMAGISIGYLHCVVFNS